MDSKIDNFFYDIEKLLRDIDTAYEQALLRSAEAPKYNKRMYSGLIGDMYDFSFANYDYSKVMAGAGLGKLFSFLMWEAYSLIGYSFDKKTNLRGYYMDLIDDTKKYYNDGGLTYNRLFERIRKYLTDSCRDVYNERVKDMLLFQNSNAYRIVTKENLSNAFYLYKYGEYITENELDTARFLDSIPQKDIETMAGVFTEGYRKGFETTNKPFDKKKTVGIIYKLGYERLVREEIKQFEDMGLKTTLFRTPKSALLKRNMIRNGFYGANPNEQAEYDHMRDILFFSDQALYDLRLRSIDESYWKYTKEADVYGGPAVMEVFGQPPFDFKETATGFDPTEKQEQAANKFRSEASRITNKYIKGEERSYTIIAYPEPAIGENFKEIFYDTARLNTLDSDVYEEVQQKLIDVLNTACTVHVLGKSGNETNLKISLMKATDPETQEIFENCVADVNIPVGEVFTSPKLKGTQGVLAVKKVFLNGCEYRNLKIEIRDGMIADYSCSNFSDPEKNKEYFKKNVMYDHETLPMGEFAIGTNTVAYMMSKRYGIEEVMPILIAEKCGPHFAFGDTCYSHAEDVRVFNPNGKEIIAKENEISAKRNTDPDNAYFNCHTDITIPYEEIGSLIAVDRNQRVTVIIRDGRFVLEGTEILNEPFDENY